MTVTARRLFILAVVALLLGIVIGVIMAATASAEDCDPAYTAQCCACEPSEAADPAPLPRIYLPSVQRSMPPMSAEYTPAQPVATPEPDVELPLGDAGENNQDTNGANDA